MRKLFQKFVINFRYAFRIKKPRLILRLIKTYLSILFWGRRPLRYVDFAIGFKCNMNCKHCFATTLVKDQKRITPKEYSRVVKQAMDLGAVHFSFQGGEPLLYHDLAEYIKAARPKENLISVTTNGVLLTEEKIKELKAWHVDILTVSLDSGIRQEHDSFRQMKGAFDKALKGIKLASKYNINVTIGALVSHQNVRSDGLKKLIELSRHLKVILMLILAVPIGRWKNNRDILVTKKDTEYINELTSSSSYVRTDFDANYLYKGCGAVKEILYITPYGDVLACPFIHISLGNIFEKRLEEIRNTALENKYFKNYWQKCLCGTDRKFIDEFLSKVSDSEILPVEYKEIFL